MRRYARQDSNHKEIRAAFERYGCSVADLSSLGKGCPDLLIGFAGFCICVEVKDGSKPPSARKLTPDEEKFRMNWKGGYKLVENLDHVLETVNVLKGWQAAIFANLRTTEPLLVAPPVTKGKAESTQKYFEVCFKALRIVKLNQFVDDYDLTSNDTRRGD